MENMFSNIKSLEILGDNSINGLVSKEGEVLTIKST